MNHQPVAAAERATYAEMWQVPAYRSHSPGAMYAPLFLSMSRAKPGDTVLDAGCGAGAGARALQTLGLDVRCCDITDEGMAGEDFEVPLPFQQVVLWDDVVNATGPTDWVYCCDVMEHLPKEYSMLVIYQLLRVAQKGAFFSISLQPDAMGAWVGKPLHQTVEGFTWWRDRFRELGTVHECRDLLGMGLYLVGA